MTSWLYQPLPMAAALASAGGGASVTASTTTYLRSFDAAEVAFVLIFEGYDLAYTTHQDVSGIASALSTATGGLWTNVKGGLEYPGKIPSSLDMFDAKIEAGSAAFSIIDHDDALIRLLSRQADDTIARTELTATADANDTTLTLADTSAFAASGTAYCGNEQLTYTGKTATTLTGVTRGKRALFYSASGTPFEFGAPHTVDSDLGETGAYRPLVTSEPRTFFNRQVALYLCHREGSNWSAPTSTAKILWVGRLKNWSDSGDGRVRLETVGITERLSTTLLPNQYRGKIAEGLYLTARDALVRVEGTKTGGSSVSATHYVWNTAPYQTLDGVGSYQTHEQIASSVDKALHAIFNASPGTYFTDSDIRMTLALKTDEQSGKRTYEFELLAPSAAANETYTFRVWMAPEVWRVLGWEDTAGTSARDTSGNTVLGFSLYRERSNTVFHLKAPDAPLKYMIRRTDAATGYRPQQLTITALNGTTYVPQSSVPTSMNRDNPTGFLRFGEVILPVKVSSTSGDVTIFDVCGATVGTFLIREGLDEGSVNEAMSKKLHALRDDQNSEELIVEQVWVESGKVGEILLKLLVSTGTAGYNHASYDYFPLGMGAGIPWTLVDSTAWLNIGRHDYLLLVEKPTPLRTLLESALKVTGHYCVLKDGLISIVTVGEEWSGSTRIVALTEANKAQVVRGARERVSLPSQTSYSPDGIINRMTLRFNRSVDGKFNREITVNARASQTDHGQTRANVMDAYGFYEINGFLQGAGIAAWQNDVAATALAYFSRPLAQIDRTCDFQVATRLYPGARVSIVDNRIVDARTGQRGVSAALGWCTKVDVDWRTGVGEITCIFSPDLAGVRLGAWAPSARVDETANSGGFTRGYDSATKRLKVKQHEYSLSTEDTDVSYFAAGDKVRVVHLDPAHPHNPQTWTDTIVSADIANDYVTLTTGLSGFPTGSGNFVLEYDDAATVTATQLAENVFLAAPTTLTTGVAARDAKLYGAREVEKPNTAFSFSGKYQRRRYSADDQAEPFSVHKVHELMDVANGLLGGASCPQPVCWQQDDGAISSAGSTTFELMAGPIFVPVRMPTRLLEVSVCARIYKGAILSADNPGTIRVRSSIGLPRGTATAQPWAGVSHLDGLTAYADIAVSNSTVNYQTLLSDMAVVPTSGGKTVIGFWVTVEARVTGGTDRINLRGFTVREKAW